MRPRKCRSGGCRPAQTRRDWVCTQRPHTWRGVCRILGLSRTLRCNRPLIGHLMPSTAPQNGNRYGHRPRNGNRAGSHGQLMPSTAPQNGNRYGHRRRSKIGTQSWEWDGHRLQGHRRQLLSPTRPTSCGLTSTHARLTIRPTAVERRGRVAGAEKGLTTGITDPHRGTN